MCLKTDYFRRIGHTEHKFMMVESLNHTDSFTKKLIVTVDPDSVDIQRNHPSKWYPKLEDGWEAISEADFKKAYQNALPNLLVNRLLELPLIS